MQEEGISQGSVLSLVLFAVAINGISSVIPADVLLSFFVDDLSLSNAASMIWVAECKLQPTLAAFLSGRIVTPDRSGTSPIG